MVETLNLNQPIILNLRNLRNLWFNFTVPPTQLRILVRTPSRIHLKITSPSPSLGI